MPFKHDYFCIKKLHTLYIILSGGGEFPGIVGYIGCGALTAVLVGSSMESGGVIYLVGTWIEVLECDLD